MVYYGQELYHHGILGMKWGVRRYQNYDGSYTKAGLARYNKALNDYNTTKSNSAKKKLDTSYDELKKAYRVDEGKKLSEQGKTITDNKKNLVTAAVSEAAIIVGADFASSFLQVTGNYGLVQLSQKALKIGGTAVNAMSLMNKVNDNKNLRAYNSRTSES